MCGLWQMVCDFIVSTLSCERFQTGWLVVCFRNHIKWSSNILVSHVLCGCYNNNCVRFDKWQIKVFKTRIWNGIYKSIGWNLSQTSCQNITQNSTVFDIYWFVIYIRLSGNVCVSNWKWWFTKIVYAMILQFASSDLAW